MQGVPSQGKKHVTLGLLARIDASSSEASNKMAQDMVNSDVFAGYGLIKVNANIHFNENVFLVIDLPPTQNTYGECRGCTKRGQANGKVG